MSKLRHALEVTITSHVLETEKMPACKLPPRDLIRDSESDSGSCRHRRRHQRRCLRDLFCKVGRGDDGSAARRTDGRTDTRRDDKARNGNWVVTFRGGIDPLRVLGREKGTDLAKGGRRRRRR